MARDPEREIALAPGRTWFRARWPADGRGVELIAWIPGYLDETTTRHDDLAAAERAAAAIYEQYCADVSARKQAS